MKKALFLVLFFWSCSDSKEYLIDSELVPYVDSFYIEAEKRGISIQKDNLVVNLATSIGSKSGLASWENGQRIVEINYYSFQNMDKMYIELIVFHELAHSLLLRDHLDGVESIMNTSPCLNCYTNENRDLYLDELFKR